MNNLEEKIKRINELYHKSKNEGLTEEEKIEQKELRMEYVASVRNSLRGQLNNIDIVEKDGSVTNLGERFNNNQANADGNAEEVQDKKKNDDN